ncbi:PilW family protein [Luteimonas sp. A537]
MSKHLAFQRFGAVRRQGGATLIELMIALLLGLVVVAAASGLFLTNKRVYASTETLNRIQENSRVSFEIMSRDIREAGGNPCGANSTIVNQLTTGDNAWWEQYGDGIRGYEAGTTAPGTARVSGTDAIDIHLGAGGNISVITHDNPSANLIVTDATSISNNDMLMVCNTELSMIFIATGVSSAGGAVGIQHNGGNTGTGAENCGQEFQFVRNCSPGASGDNGYCFIVPPGSSLNPNCDRHRSDPAQVVKIQSFRWYVAENGRGSRSLYRATLVNKTATNIPTVAETAEIAEGIDDLQLEYRDPAAGAWQSASAIGDWSVVNAVRVTFTAQGTSGAVEGRYLEGTDGSVLSRDTTHVVAIRNREGVL